jgi:hypothetical protein
MDGSLAGVDCDDRDPRRAPALRERCDGIDNDCSGVADDRDACGLWVHDASSGAWSAYALDPAADDGAPSPHAPGTAIRFALDMERLHLAYVFTDRTFHVLDVRARRWTASGSRNAALSQLAGLDAFAGYTVPAGLSGSDPNLETGAILTTTGVLAFSFDLTSRRFLYRQTDPPPTWLPPANAPTYANVRAAWLDVTNAAGWVTSSPSALCPEGAMSTRAYAGAIAGDRVHIFEAGTCFLWAPPVPFARFAPFARPGSPPLARIATTFFQNQTLVVLASP